MFHEISGPLLYIKYPGSEGGGGGEDYTSNPDKICQIQLNERMMNVSKWEQRNKKINENEIRSAGWWLVGGIEEN